jgi:hypothetical protein
LVRFASNDGDATAPANGGHRNDLRRRIAADLSGIRYASGEPVFRVREPSPREARQGAHFVVDVLTLEPSYELMVHGEPVGGVIANISDFISGTHGRDTHGIFISAGPGIRRGSRVAGIDIHDITPTLLYAMGLPVARDFAGQPWLTLFTDDFLAGNQVQQIESWGTRTVSGTAPSSGSDEQILEELRALGYVID